MKELFYIKNTKFDGKDNFISFVENEYLKQPIKKPTSWQENVHSSIWYSKTKTVEEYCQHSHVPMNLVDFLNNEVKIFLESKKISNIGKFYINEIWFNAYRKKQYQQKHKHGNYNSFSGVYYVKFNEIEHTSTRFFHPAFEIDFENPLVQNNPFFCYSPKIIEDDLIIFPSSIGHDVPQQQTEELRITVSFNVKCELYTRGVYG